MTKVFQLSTEWLVRILIAAVAAWWSYESAIPFWTYFWRVFEGASPQYPFRDWSLLLDALTWLSSHTIAVGVGAVALGHPALAITYLIAGGLLIQLPLILITAFFCLGIVGLVALFSNVGLLLIVVATVVSAVVLFCALFVAMGLFYDAEW